MNMTMRHGVIEQNTPLKPGQTVELYTKNNYLIVKTQPEFYAKFESRSTPAENTIV